MVAIGVESVPLEAVTPDGGRLCGDSGATDRVGAGCRPLDQQTSIDTFNRDTSALANSTTSSKGLRLTCGVP